MTRKKIVLLDPLHIRFSPCPLKIFVSFAMLTIDFIWEDEDPDKISKGHHETVKTEQWKTVSFKVALNPCKHEVTQSPL